MGFRERRPSRLVGAASLQRAQCVQWDWLNSTAPLCVAPSLPSCPSWPCAHVSTSHLPTPPTQPDPRSGSGHFTWLNTKALPTCPLCFQGLASVPTWAPHSPLPPSKAQIPHSHLSLHLSLSLFLPPSFSLSLSLSLSLPLALPSFLCSPHPTLSLFLSGVCIS